MKPIAALAAAAVVCALAAAASATVTPGEWNLASDGVDASGKTFVGPGSIEFVTAPTGLPIECAISDGFAYVAPDPTPHAPLGGSITLSVDPSDVIAPTHGTCLMNGMPVGATVTTTPGSLWQLTITTPASHSPSPHDGPFVATLTIPTGSISFDAGFCALVLPAPPLSMSAIYDGSAGTASKTGTPAFGIDSSACSPLGDSVALMQSTAFTLSEAGFPAKHPNLIYVP
ncbi:hypothetical protein [Nocardioides sp. L-11A]|uniref:hypothetical protein n=1 Tax=Nocardioides sp. L-11A TaxID=3043848 RepID=UPI00249ABF7E|nr:hypothetical protein QJ852_17005 [Nocardioides sp. L-11A]